MSIVPKNDQNNKPKGNRRRQKRRRTEDFSDSSSSESSDSESEKEQEEEEKTNNDTIIDQDGDAVLSDVEVEQTNGEVENFGKTKAKLQAVNLTKTKLNETSKNFNIGDISEVFKKDRADLNNDYLRLMFDNYGEEINSLRSAPDFNDRSLSILANTLKNGANIFDEDTLRAVVTE